MGKSTLYRQLFDRHPNQFALAVSHTTRLPRTGEHDGVDYHFVTRETFDNLLANNAFLEHAEYGGNRYGTSKLTVEEQSQTGRVVLLDIEMEVGFMKPLCDRETRALSRKPSSAPISRSY